MVNRAQIKCWSHDLQIFPLKLDIEELAPVMGIILTEYTLKANPRGKKAYALYP